MQEQSKHHQIQVLFAVIQNIDRFPIHLNQLQNSIRSARQNNEFLNSMGYSQIYQIMVQTNKQLIQYQFETNLTQVLQQVQPHLHKYQKQKSTEYLLHIIYQKFDEIENIEHMLDSKIKVMLAETQIIKRDLGLQDQLFIQLVIVFNQLHQATLEYYGLRKEDHFGKLEDIISSYVKQNKNQLNGQQNNKIPTNPREINSTLQRTLPNQDFFNIGKLTGKMFYSFQQINPLSQKTRKSSRTSRQSIQKIKDKISKCQSRVPLDEQTSIMLIMLMERSNKQIIDSFTQMEKDEFVELLVHFNNQGTKQKSRLSKTDQISDEIGSLVLEYFDYSTNFSNQNEICKVHKQLKWIVLVFKAFQKNYHLDSERKRFLTNFCQIPQIIDNLQNPYSIIKFIESFKMDQNQTLQHLRAIPVAQRFVQGGNNTREQEQNDCNDFLIQHELNRIHLFQLNKKYPKVPFIQFQRLTNIKRKTITLLFSGFMSEDTCKVTEWSGLLNNFYDSEVFAVRWESKSTKQMTQYVFKSIVELGTKVHPLLMAITAINVFSNNPFNPAFQSAIITGEFMAEFILANFKGYFINLVGFSLGTQLIRSLMSRMAEKKCLNMLNKVYLMGGVADKAQIEKIIKNSPTSLTIINLHSDYDRVLRYLLKICKRNIVPIGLNEISQIEGHRIKNHNCSKLMHDHLEYRANLQYYCKELNMAED